MVWTIITVRFDDKVSIQTSKMYTDKGEGRFVYDSIYELPPICMELLISSGI